MSGYSIEIGDTTQRSDAVTLDLIVRPPFSPGENLGDYLYGEAGAFAIRALGQRLDFSHIEISTSSYSEHGASEMGVMLARLENYINTEDPNTLTGLRRRDTARDEVRKLGLVIQNHPRHRSSPLIAAYETSLTYTKTHTTSMQ